MELDLVRTARLTLRPWSSSDAMTFKEAVDGSLPELVPWMPWALQEPTPVEKLAERLDGFRRIFASGLDWIYGIFDREQTRVYGGAGFHPRIGPGGVELGYWVRTDATGNGVAREAAAALTTVAFRKLAIDRVEIRMDPTNVRSRSIPRRLGFVHVTTLEGNAKTPTGASRDTEVWSMTRAAYSLAAERFAAFIDPTHLEAKGPR